MATTRPPAGKRQSPFNPALLRHVPLFAQLTDDEMKSLGANVQRQRFKKGQAIIEQGGKSNSLFIVLIGRAHVAIDEMPNQLRISKSERAAHYLDESREVIAAVLHPGDHFGEMSMIDGSPHSATVRAEVVTEVLVLGHADFTSCLAENPAMNHAVMKSLTQRLRQANAKIESLALIDVYGRVARTLLELAVIDQGTGEGRINHRLSRQYLAKVVGASREMVSRVMKDLGLRGFISEYEDGTAVLRPSLFMMR
jgi:CRP-like cAMP-binding protein